MTNPGSKGEHTLQKKFNTEKRAQAFYDNQVLDRLNPRMVEFMRIPREVCHPFHGKAAT